MTQWTCRRDYTPPCALIDPRIAIAKHINWNRPHSETEWSQPEPDNYNRAVLDHRARFCDFVSEQVYYYDEYRQGWISCYYVPDSQHAQFDAWLSHFNPPAVWRIRGVALRQRRPLLWNRKGSMVVTDNERLYTLGYYDYLAKYFSKGDIRLRLPVGEARAELADLLQVAVDKDPPEDPDSDLG